MTLPIPPIVSQRSTVLPDGSPDPAGRTDCGEACVSSAVQAIASVMISPGCIRQALRLPMLMGNSTASELEDLLNKIGRRAYSTAFHGSELTTALSRLRHHGRYGIVLGDWVSDGVAHWVLAYEGTERGTWVMDPWNAWHWPYPHEYVAKRARSSQVWVS